MRMTRRGPLLWLLAAGAAVTVAACSTPGEHLPAAETSQGDPARGAKLIESYGCGSCHVIPGVRGANGLVGPPLTQFGRRSYIAGVLPNNAGNLQHWIQDPQDVVPGNAMPDLGVGQIDAQDIAAYLDTLG